MSRFSIILVLLLVCLYEVNAAAVGGKWKCDEEDKKKIDDLVAKIMTVGRTDTKFPEDKEGLKVFCKSETESAAKLEDYKDKCLKDQPKQIVSVIIYSMKGLINAYCKNPNSKKTKELIASAKCANEAGAGYLTCSNSYVDLLMAVYDSKDSQKRLGQMCCGYVEVFKCLDEKAKAQSVCTEKHSETHKQFVRAFFDNAVNIICGDYNEQSDKCDNFKLTRKGGKSVKSRPVSFFNPLVHTLANL